MIYILCFLAGGLVIGAIIRSAPYEPDTLHERLADAAVKYCEYRRLNRMESFQRAAWDDYVAVTEEITTALHPEARRPAPPVQAGYVAHGAPQ